MSQIKPFRAYRPKTDLAAKVASVPYDVINTREARELSAGNPVSFLRVGRPEVDLPEGVDEHSSGTAPSSGRTVVSGMYGSWRSGPVT